MADNYDYLFKVIVIGDKRVGKSSLITRFREDSFEENSLPPTIGVDFLGCDLLLKDAKVKLQLWDTSGEEEYKAVTSIYYRGAHAAIIAFDITRPETFEHAKEWMEEAYIKCGTDVKIIFVGNKCDLSPKVDLEEIRNFTEMNLSYLCTASARDGTNIKEIFRRISFDLIELQSQLLSLPSQSNGPGSLFLNDEDLRQSYNNQYCCSGYFSG